MKRLLLSFLCLCMGHASSHFYNKPYAVGRLYKSLAFIDKVFNEEGITYWITDGTLLGAIRHHAFIPWDRDANLHIFAKDIPKLLSLEEKLKPFGLFLTIDRRRSGPDCRFIIHSRGTICREGYFDNNKRRYLIAEINIIAIGYNRNLQCYLPIRAYFNKHWPEDFVWLPEEIQTRNRYPFGPITLWGPLEGKAYLMRHYGQNVFAQIEGGDFGITPPFNALEYPAAPYDFAPDELPDLPEAFTDPLFLGRSRLDGNS